MKSIFITGIDTDIGKTFVSVGLCLAQNDKGYKVGYFKPFQSGAYKKDNLLVAPDLAELKKYIEIPAKYSYLFKGEVSPHLASILDNVEVDINKVKKDFIDFSSKNDVTIIEGAGGLYCPAYKGKLFADVIKELNQEIIIVATPSLGRLNHLLMTIECAKIKGIKIKGIILNKVSKSPTLSEANFLRELKLYSDVEVLASINEMPNPTKEEIIEQFKDIEL